MTPPVRKVCLGGSFNPVHYGHLLCARAAAEAVGAQKVVLIPTAVSPLKMQESDLAPASDRLEMCRLATAGIADFELDDREIRRGNASFTIDTARELKKSGWSEVTWLIGADLLPGLPKWHESDALLNEVRFVLMARPRWSVGGVDLPVKYAALLKNVVPVPQIDISASEIRRRLGAGLPIDFFTPPSVVRYIRDRGLYR
ncbi:MAG: nicotinate (nicotinamide) nucleotide adenylyltransferase [Tepidisphaeraceae bacterium]|jgi:nicotinate-nucleotide adenylyltransferase